MKNKNISRLIIPAGILSLALIFLSTGLIQAQMQTKGKPPGKGQSCNDNGMCERGEFNDRFGHEEQPCLDCRMKNYLPLQMVSDPGAQIVGSFSNLGKIFQFKFENGKYTDTWASVLIAENTSIFQEIGDLNHDGKKEIIAVVNYKYSTGKGKNKKLYFDQKIFLFCDGSDGTPYHESENFGYSAKSVRYIAVGDVNNDGEDEVILDKQNWVEIYKWNGIHFEQKWISPTYESLVFRVDISDADGDGKNDLILAMFDIGAPILWEFDEDFNGEKTVAEPIDVLNPNPNIDFLGIDHARGRDADNDGFPEIIAGGNNNRLMVWKYLWDESSGTFRYKSVFISDDLGDFTQGIDSGDVVGDGNNEIIVGTASGLGESMFYIFDLVLVDLDTYTYRLDLIDSELLSGVSELSVADLDGDGLGEIVIADGYEMDVYEYVEGILEKTYTSLYGGIPKVK